LPQPSTGLIVRSPVPAFAPDPSEYGDDEQAAEASSAATATTAAP
jgi:hypothetical protein